jgi:pimeloyl-ACP methyl ester carboxylesterase
VAQGFATVDKSERAIRVEGGTRQLAGKPVEVVLNRDKFKWDFAEIEAFLPADEFELYGLAVRDRKNGLGSPLIVAGKNLDKKKYARRFPASLFLHVPANLKTLDEGKMTLTLELISSFEHRTVEVNGQEMQLEADKTAPLAYALNDASLWKLDLAQFFSNEERIRSGVYFTQPYDPGRIPVVFVHGTASSPIWWADMWNTLRTDSVLSERFQYWHFTYNTGNPVSRSANRLREELNKKLEQLDPHGKDPALRQMVVIGHSQGGLLTKLTATDTGDKLWRTVTTNELASLELTPEIKAALQTNFFFKPLPFVQRVVFISTPHRGSYLATGFVRQMARKLMKLPKTVATTPATMMKLGEQLQLPPETRGVVPTSLDGMSPNNKWLLTLSDIPPAPGVKAHSIVAIKGNDTPPNGGDGVVKYTSAHVPYVESEFVVGSGHSCQDKPAVIEEVRRILLLHLTESPLSP